MIITGLLLFSADARSLRKGKDHSSSTLSFTNNVMLRDAATLLGAKLHDKQYVESIGNKRAGAKVIIEKVYEFVVLGDVADKFSKGVGGQDHMIHADSYAHDKMQKPSQLEFYVKVDMKFTKSSKEKSPETCRLYLGRGNHDNTWWIGANFCKLVHNNGSKTLECKKNADEGSCTMQFGGTSDKLKKSMFRF